MAGLPKEKCRYLFEKAQRELEYKGYDVVNPAKIAQGLPGSFTREQCIDVQLCALKYCDAIYMLSDFKNSQGAMEELNFAHNCGIEIIYENPAQAIAFGDED